MNPRVLFVFNRARADRQAAFERGEGPDDALYAFNALRRRGLDTVFSDIGHDIRGVGLLYKAADDALSGGGRRVGFHWWQAKRLLPELRRADLVFATADSSALPVLWLRRRGLFRAPVVYASIGLTQAFPQARGRLFHFYCGLAQSAERVLAYSEREVAALGRLFGIAAARLNYVPFGVDTEFYRSSTNTTSSSGAPLSLGLDPNRDWATLAAASTKFDAAVDVVAIPDRLAGLAIPSSWRLREPMPHRALRDLMSAASFVVLPVKPNDYSGATITLLSALALGRAVIVTRTASVDEGYGLRHGENVWLVPPADAGALADAMRTLAADPALRERLGAAGHEHVTRAYTNEHMADRLATIFREVLP